MIYASRTARRYARAVYTLASQQGRQQAVLKELGDVQAVFERVPELPQVLSHRRIPLERKLALLQQSFAEVERPAEEAAAEGNGASSDAAVSAETLDFLRIVVRHQRIELLGQMVAALQEMIDAEQGVVRATVTTAVPLLRSERDMIVGKLKQHTGANDVVLDARVSKRVIAGVLIHVGDHVIDATVRTYLDTMRERLRQVRVAEFAERGYMELPEFRNGSTNGANGGHDGHAS